ncbi:hypothetical protein Vadar_032102 [Vaccinium darrowii]|uniref:Uncharacterized protein n=1 Tax=Vaccinium darrowii TaxID=229202 RepID=A0ACB7Z7I8_9ERIC|nr:hypothetical protein Vadar_032102 [Vaccinium darrowii]
MNHQNSNFFTFIAYTLIILFFTTYSTVEAQQRSTNISLSSSLTPDSTNSSWLSRSGLYAFGFYRRGSGYAVGVFAAGIPEKTVVWTANRDDPPVPSNATLAFIDGKLVLNNPQGENTNIADVSQSISTASMLDSGNFVLYNSVRAIIWQSFDNPTDTILPGQPLVAGKRLVSSFSEADSSSGLFRLEMQKDGNLVSYPLPFADPYAYYATGTYMAGENITLNLDDNGHLYLLNLTGDNIIQNLTAGESSNDGKIYRMTLNADGIFRVYSRTLDPKGNWSVKWYSSADMCAPIGLCGLNGYCIMIDDKADCRCLPGFNFINPQIWSQGCERSFAAVSCNNTKGGNITMSKFENMSWEDESYMVVELPNIDDCERSCFEDCNCEVALYSDGKNCKKQKLPLRYGRRSLGTSQVAFIKVTKEPLALPPKGTEKELRLEIVLIIGASLITFAFMVLTVSGFLIYRNRVWVYKKISEQGHIEVSGDIVLRTFTFAELEEVTNGFREELGRGASGTVYKGIIPYNQKVVAVKKLEKARKCLDWSRGEDEAVLEDWVCDCFEARELGKLVGHEEEVDKRKLERMVKVALWCIQDEPSLRPSMKKVLLMIEGTVDIPTPPSPTSFLSSI